MYLYSTVLVLLLISLSYQARTNVITQSEKIGLGQLLGPESLVFGSDGLLYTGCGSFSFIIQISTIYKVMARLKRST
jgi:hypothetical protein